MCSAGVREERKEEEKEEEKGMVEYFHGAPVSKLGDSPGSVRWAPAVGNRTGCFYPFPVSHWRSRSRTEAIARQYERRLLHRDATSPPFSFRFFRESFVLRVAPIAFIFLRAFVQSHLNLAI